MPAGSRPAEPIRSSLRQLGAEEYVARWRIRAAARDLRGGTRKISSLAAQWGNSSESAFSHAFKRIMGTSPGRYR